MSRTDIQQNLLDAMQILSQQAANNTGADKTIKAVIKEIVDAGKNIYIIEYGGNKFEAGSFGSSYQIGDIVYVLIPQGDFSQNKVILGNAGSRFTLLQSGIEKVSYTTVAKGLMNTEDIDLKSWIDKTRNIPIQNSDFIRLFSSYIQDGERLFCFSAKVKTEIDITHRVNGNYGLRLSIPLKNPDTGAAAPRIYVMDVNTMPGSPYFYDEFQSVKLYYTIPEDLIYDNTQLPILSAFVEGFGYGEVDTTDPAYAESHFDIHIKDIDLLIVNEKTNEEIEGYSLSLVSSNGNYFLQGDYGVTKTILPNLTFDGKETSPSGWSCYWLIEDAAVGPATEGYIPEAGTGWRCMNAKTNISIDSTGREIYQYVLTDYSLLVKESDVISKLRYRCILVNNDTVLSSIITLQNLKNDIDFSLNSVNGTTTYVQRVGSVNLIARIWYPDLIPAQERLYVVWQREDAEGNASQDFSSEYTIIKDNEKADDGYYEFEIQFPVSLVDQFNIINCTFYCEKTFNQTTTNSILGTASISVNTVEKLDYRIMINNSDIVYKYDSDGDSPLIAQYDGPISSRLENEYPISFRVFKDDGIELTNEEYAAAAYTWSFPINSMMTAVGTPSRQDEDYYYFTGYGQNILTYDIAPIFDKTKSNNTIILTIDFAGNIVTQSFTIKFLKDGESGTNGSKYSAIILSGKDNNYYGYGERDKNKNIRKYHAIYVNNKWYYYDIDTKKLANLNSVNFIYNIYKDGKDITQDLKDSSKYPYLYENVKWSWFDSTDEGNRSNINKTCLRAPSGNPAVISDGSAWSESGDGIYTHIIQLTIRIKESENSIRTIRAYYPIEITKVYNTLTPTQITNTWAVPDLIGGYSHVLYEANGKNPDWDSSNPFSCINTFEGDADPAQYHTYEWDCSINNTLISDSGDSAIIEPLPDYNSGDSANYVKVSISQSRTQYQALNEQIGNYQEQIDLNTEQISAYENLRKAEQHLVDNFKNLEYNKYNDNLLLLNYRNQGIQIVKNLRDAIQNYYEYCVGMFKGDTSIYNYISMYNQNLNNCDRAETVLYGLLLPNQEDFDDLINLTYYLIDLSEYEINIKNKYGIGAFNQLNYYAEQWNQLINIKYTNIYNILKQKNQQSPYNYIHQDSLNRIKSITNDIINFSNDENLRYLVEHSDDTNNYISLNAAVQAAISRLLNKETRLADSYSSIMREVITPLQNALYIYQQDNYRDNYFENMTASLKAENDNLSKNRNQLQEDISNLGGETTSILTIVHIRPIIMLLNNTELSYLDDWDGNKFYVNSNETYFFAPQIGAGIKNGNYFTGIIMGQRKANSSTTVDTGLFGYYNNIQSIFLDASTGNAIFGRPGYNQITITPTSNEIHFTNTNGKIYSGNHNKLQNSYEGFYLSSDGMSIQHLNGNGLYFETGQGLMRLGYNASTDTSDKPKCWIINGNSTSSYLAYRTTALNYDYSSPTPFAGAETQQVYIGTNGIRLGNKFGVDNQGRLTGSDVKLTGILESSSGNYIARVGDGAFRTLLNNSTVVELGTQSWHGDSNKIGMALNAYSVTGSCKFIGFGRENPIYTPYSGTSLPSASNYDLSTKFYLINGDPTYYYIYTCRGTASSKYWDGGTTYKKSNYSSPDTRWINSLVLNYGLNPDNITAQNIFYDNTNFQGDVIFNGAPTCNSGLIVNNGAGIFNAGLIVNNNSTELNGTVLIKNDLTISNGVGTFNKGIIVNSDYHSEFGSGRFKGNVILQNGCLQIYNKEWTFESNEFILSIEPALVDNETYIYFNTGIGNGLWIDSDILVGYRDFLDTGATVSVLASHVNVNDDGEITSVDDFYLNFCRGIFVGQTSNPMF